MSNIQCYSCKEYENILTIIERSYTIIANTKDILSRSDPPLVLKIMRSMLVIAYDNPSIIVESGIITLKMVQQMIASSFSALKL